MFYFISRNIRKECDYIRNSLSQYSQDVVAGTGAVISLLGFVTSIICFAVLIVKFASTGGYENIFSRLLPLKGNAGDFYAMPYRLILGGFSAAMLIMSYIRFFKNEKWGFRIVGIIPFIVVVISQIIYFYMVHLCTIGKIQTSDETRKLAKVLIIASIVSVIISIIVLIIREKGMIISCVRMLIFSFVILPLITLCIENIIALVAVIVFVFVLGIISNTNFESGSNGNHTFEKASDNRHTEKITGSTGGQNQAIADINRKYKEESAKIVKAHNEVGAAMFSDSTNRELSELRKKLEAEAEAKGVKGKVSIY